MATSSVPGATDSSVDPLSIIPAANIPAAAAAVQQAGGQNNPQVMQMIDAMRKQLDALAGNVVADQLGDVVLVNPHGRIVEVSGELATEYMGKVGFRKATPDEEANYRKAILRQTPEYLRRQEIKRLQAEKAMLDELEAEDAGSAVSNDELLRAPVTDSQRTGAPAPAAPVTPAPAAPNQTTTTQTANETQTNNGADQSTPKPPSRRAKAAPNQTNTPPKDSTSQNTNTPE